MDVFKPSPKILMMLANAVSHAEEALNSKERHAFDVYAFNTCLRDSELQSWMHEMVKQSLVSLPRRGNHWMKGGEK